MQVEEGRGVQVGEGSAGRGVQGGEGSEGRGGE